MKRLLSSLHFTRWLRVVAIAGVVVAYGASADMEPKEESSYSAARSSMGWCPRC